MGHRYIYSSGAERFRGLWGEKPNEGLGFLPVNLFGDLASHYLDLKEKVDLEVL